MSGAFPLRGVRTSQKSMSPLGNFRSNSGPAARCYPNGLLHAAIRSMRRMVRAALGRAELYTVTKNFDRRRHTVAAVGTSGRASRSPASAVSGYANHCAEVDQTIKASEDVSPMAIGPAPMARDLCLGGVDHVVRIEAEALGDDLR